jgi:hypothetical protein
MKFAGLQCLAMNIINKKEKAVAELKAANIEAALSPAAARRALGGISPATEFRWNKSGLLVPFYLHGKKLYNASRIRKMIENGGEDFSAS